MEQTTPCAQNPRPLVHGDVLGDSAAPDGPDGFGARIAHRQHEQYD